MALLPKRRLYVFITHKKAKQIADMVKHKTLRLDISRRDVNNGPALAPAWMSVIKGKKRSKFYYKLSPLVLDHYVV